MKIEFTRAEVEQIVLHFANSIAPDANFDTVEPCGYRSMPDGFVVSTKPKQETEDAAQ
jgi:hypothetical protein